VTEHVQALQDHIGPKLFDYVIYNSNLDSARNIKPEWNVSAVTLAADARKRFPRIEFVPADVVRDDNPLRHDPTKLADAVYRLYQRRRGTNGTSGNGRQNIRRNGADEESEPSDRDRATKAL
jgi:hypothetical protein